MKFNLLKALFVLFSSNIMFAQTINAPMGGAWYCMETKEIFAITTDDNNTIQGKGVWFAKGGSSFKQMQIMTQTNTDAGYMMRCYDPAKPNMVYDLKSYYSNYSTRVTMTRTGSRSKTYFFYDLDYGVPDTKGFGKKKAWEIFRRSLYDKSWTDIKRPNNPLTFNFKEGYAQATQDGHTERFVVNDNTFEISTFLQAFGKVKIKLLFDEAWYLEVKNLDGEILSLLSPK